MRDEKSGVIGSVWKRGNAMMLTLCRSFKCTPNFATVFLFAVDVLLLITNESKYKILFLYHHIAFSNSTLFLTIQGNTFDELNVLTVYRYSKPSSTFCFTNFKWMQNSYSCSSNVFAISSCPGCLSHACTVLQYSVKNGSAFLFPMVTNYF